MSDYFERIDDENIIYRVERTDMFNKQDLESLMNGVKNSLGDLSEYVSENEEIVGCCLNIQMNQIDTNNILYGCNVNFPLPEKRREKNRDYFNFLIEEGFDDILDQYEGTHCIEFDASLIVY